MEDKILKQIEEEALKLFPLDEYDDELFSERYNWRNGAKFGYNIKENVDEKIIKAYREGYYNKSVGMQYLLDNEIIESFNPPLCASQNTVSKSAPSQVVEEAMKAASINVRVPNVVRNGDVVPQNTVSNEGEKWVSVDDRLPEAYETIISYNIHTDEVSTDYIDDEKRWDVLNPTHWMPLPQPPKEK